MSQKWNSRKNKKWWAPMWNGLVMDADAAHFKKMGIALWLYFYLIVNANRNSGVVIRKVRTISADTGIPRRTILRWIETLRQHNYIRTKTSGRFLTISINKWKALREAAEMAPQKCQTWHRRGAKSGTSHTPSDTQKPAWLKEKLAAWPVPKKNTIKENNLKKLIDKINSKDFAPMAFKTREELLAYDLARALDDSPGFPLYLTLARKYPESLLRETLGRVKEIPKDEIKTSRGALFNFLIQKHAIKSTFDPRR